jgi:Uma2 family endonuclease
MIRKAADIPVRETEPAWEIARLFPGQGDWDEAEYLALTRDTNHFVELVDGNVEVHEMPTLTHQLIVAFLSRVIGDFVSLNDQGITVFGPLRVRLRARLIREPDIMVMLKENAARAGEEFWQGADLVVEVVSKDDKSRRRDLKEKRQDYAQARIREYWIVDPQEESITVLKLSRTTYAVHGEWTGKEVATSALLKGFQVQVSEVFAAAKKAI